MTLYNKSILIYFALYLFYIKSVDDFDQKIIDHLAEEFKKEQGIDLKNDRQALQRLRDAADKAKVELSTKPETEINIPYITADQTELPVERAGDLFRSGDVVQVASERMRVISASDDTLRVERALAGTDARRHRVKDRVFEPGDEILVERAAFGTQADEHEQGAQLYGAPLEPPTGALTGEEGTPPCGQRAPVAASTPTPSPTPAQ